MKLMKIPRFKARNLTVLNPLLHKGGVHHEEKIDVARMRERRATQLKLKQTDWLNRQLTRD